ncbi:MAG: carbohydrate binding family 9 domain-containing protein [Saprospiraceae bacterium]|nr:carbohydrate binding family 9 domain-containing protein [Saprospiraceae bacterium]
MQLRYILPFILALCCFTANAQSGEEPYTLYIKKAKAPIQLDGELNEADWQDAQVATDFFQNFPQDTAFAALQTEVRMTFDGDFLYVGALIRQKRADYIITSLKRDFDSGATDVFTVNIDPFSDKINGFHFAVSPYNVQREGIIDNGENINTDWDNKWYSKVRNYDDHWTVEMAIPFKTLRYKAHDGQNVWRIGFARNSVKQNELSSWVPVPRQFSPNNLAFAGQLVWEERPPAPGLNVSIIPYAAAGSARDFEFKLPTEGRFNAGADVKIAVTPSLNLDLTFNPDFSQVEVDRQLTNLSRFELFFPERRQFFLENEDLFSRFGFPNSRPFFSRRIGLARGVIQRTTTDGQLISVERSLDVPILAGARLSGKLDNNWRVGLLNMQSAAVADIGLQPANYSVGVLQRKVFDRSYVGAIVVNKENFIPKAGGGYELDKSAFNRIVGLEYNLFSKDNKWEGELYYHRSFSAGSNRDAQSAALFLGRFTREWQLFFPTQYMGRDFRADMGFVPRTGFFATSPGMTRMFFPKNSKIAKRIISYGAAISSDFIFNTGNEFRLVDRNLSPGIFVEFPGQSQFWFDFVSNYTYLFFPFDPTNSGGEQLPEGSDYTYNSVRTGFNSDLRRKLYFNASFQQGAYFNGRITQVSGALNYRLQPYGIFALSYNYNNIQLPEPYNSANFWLVGPRAELAFSRSLFFSLFLQYNTQIDNVNINARLQWRFRPVSDLFLVYTDNYFSEGFFAAPMAKNRALVLKATYWLNL